MPRDPLAWMPLLPGGQGDETIYAADGMAIASWREDGEAFTAAGIGTHLRLCCTRCRLADSC
jgi:hypothetical protein